MNTLELNRAVFLDRDGVINKDLGYVYKQEDFIFIDGIFTLSKLAREMGFKLIVVTNQSGIGRGFYSEIDFIEITQWMLCKFEENGAPIDKVYYSPFHPTWGKGNYKKKENTRKPGIGMINEARVEFNLDLKKSIIIGDRESDILAGKKAGIGTIIYISSKNSSTLNREEYIRMENLTDLCYFFANDLKKKLVGL